MLAVVDSGGAASGLERGEPNTSLPPRATDPILTRLFVIFHRDMHIQRNDISFGAIPPQPNEMTYQLRRQKNVPHTKTVRKQTKPPEYNVNNYLSFWVVDK